jgi:hypothetical protein
MVTLDERLIFCPKSIEHIGVNSINSAETAAYIVTGRMLLHERPRKHGIRMQMV